MQGISKYKITMIIIIFMFIFVIAAMYSNTKDVTEQRIKLNETPEIQQNISDVNNEERNVAPEDNSYAGKSVSEDDVNAKLFALTERIDNVEKAIFTVKNSSSGTDISCSIKGIISDEHFVPMSDQDAIKESKENNKEIVMSCMFK